MIEAKDLPFGTVIRVARTSMGPTDPKVDRRRWMVVCTPLGVARTVVVSRARGFVHWRLPLDPDWWEIVDE